MLENGILAACSSTRGSIQRLLVCRIRCGRLRVGRMSKLQLCTCKSKETLLNDLTDKHV